MTPPFDALPAPLLYGLVIGLAAVIVTAGVRLAGRADELADATGWGEAAVGAVLLGGSTSLPGIVASVTAAAEGRPVLAISNAIGGIAVQTFWLAIADMFTRPNLEHAAASLTNLFQATHLVALLSIPLIAATLPVDPLIAGVSPFTVLLVAAYGAGIWAAGRNRLAPMWVPKKTRWTAPEVDAAPAARHVTRRLLGTFLVLAVITGGAGFLLTEAAIEVSRRTGLNDTAVGGLGTGVITSLPELVTAIAAVRRGAPTLAVGAVIGGNAFDTLFLAFADIAYAGDTSLYAHFAGIHMMVVLTTVLMTAVLLMGLLTRQLQGIRIGYESWLVIFIYGGLAVAMGTAP